MNNLGGERHPFNNDDLFRNRIEKPELEEYDMDSYEESLKKLDKLKDSLTQEAQKTGTESSNIFKKRCSALEEVERIAEGVAQPLPQIDDLEKEKYFFVSYSRRNEEKVRRLYLSFCSGGMLSYFDNQETHSVLRRPASQEDQNSSGQGRRKLVIGENYKEGLVKGVEENAYFIVFLTSEAIEKFDVIGGLEIREALNKHNSIVVAYTDESVFEKLKVLNSEYPDAVKALNEGTHVLLDDADFSKKPKELCSKIIDTVLKKESDNIENNQKDATKKGGMNIRGISNELIESLEESKTEYGYKKRLNDCKTIIMSESDPESLIKTGKIMNKAFVGYFNDTAGEFESLKKALSKYGLKEKTMEEIGPVVGKDNYVLLPVDEDLMGIEPDEFRRIFLPIDYNNSPLWVLPHGDFFSKLSDYLKAYPEKQIVPETKFGQRPKPESSLDFKIRFLRKISEIQAIQVDKNEIQKNPDGFAKYLLKEQAMAESTKTFSGN